MQPSGGPACDKGGRAANSPPILRLVRSPDRRADDVYAYDWAAQFG